MTTVLNSLSALTPEMVAPPVPLGSNSNVLVTFAAEIATVRGAIVALKTGGLNACAYAAVLAWQLANIHGQGKAEIKTAITGGAGPVSDKTVKRVHLNATRLALRWTTNGLPNGLRAAQTFDAACSAALEYLGAEAVTSQEGLESWLNGIKPKAKVSPIAERIEKAMQKAKKNNALSGADIAAIAKALCAVSTGKGQLGRISAIVATATAELAKVEAKHVAPKTKKPAKVAPVAKAA